MQRTLPHTELLDATLNGAAARVCSCAPPNGAGTPNPRKDPGAMTDLSGPSELMRLLDIRFDERSPSRVTGSIAADERHHQPWGLVHGGLYTTAIETFATTGAYKAARERGQHVVGVSN